MCENVQRRKRRVSTKSQLYERQSRMSSEAEGQGDEAARQWQRDGGEEVPQ